jgi:hypothetical protein
VEVAEVGERLASDRMAGRERVRDASDHQREVDEAFAVHRDLELAQYRAEVGIVLDDLVEVEHLVVDEFPGVGHLPDYLEVAAAPGVLEPLP